jgi:hypothetical protein
VGFRLGCGAETLAEPLSKRLAEAKTCDPIEDQGAQRLKLYTSQVPATSEKDRPPN